jgi:hypothetical protein
MSYPCVIKLNTSTNNKKEEARITNVLVEAFIV